MNIAPTIINSLILALSLGTVGSILVHDTNVDKATMVALAARMDSEAGVAQPGNMPHTHSERNSLYQAVRDIHSSQPRTQPRNTEDERYH